MARKAFTPDAETPPSRSQRKRDATSLQELGEALARLAPGVQSGLPLSPALREALTELRRASTREARRRQMQFIGRVMREDADIPAIREALDALQGAHNANSVQFQRLETLRADLLAADAAGLDSLLTPYGDEAAALRALVLKAREEKAQGRPPRAFRALFRALAAQSAD